MYTLDDGVALNQEFPESFFIPTKQEKAALQIGDIVKLIFRENEQVERMWVVINKPPVNNNNLLCFEGTLDNSPYELSSIKLDDNVEFNENHIITIFTPPK